MRDKEPQWVVWYLHWRYHRSRVETDTYRDKDAAFYGAWYKEVEAEDCVNEVIGIEDPTGTFIDLAEWKAAFPEMQRKQDEWEERSRTEYEERPKYRITITGPPRPQCASDGQRGDFYQDVEVWSDRYIDKYRERALAQFGPDRVKVEKLTN